MAIKQVPVIDAAEATQSINYAEEGGGLNQIVQLSGGGEALPVAATAGGGLQVVKRTGPIAHNTSNEILFQTSSPCVLEGLAAGSDHGVYPYISIEYRDSSGNYDTWGG